MADVKKNCLASLSLAPISKAQQAQVGKDFYKFFFTNHPDLRKYFKGAENFTADDVQKSDSLTVLFDVGSAVSVTANIDLLNKEKKYSKAAVVSAEFEKLGSGLLLSVHILANTFDNEDVFRAFCRETIDRHVGRGLDPALWKAFWSVWVAFLESKGGVSGDQKAAWDKLGTVFNDECQHQLAKHGLPHL